MGNPRTVLIAAIVVCLPAVLGGCAADVPAAVEPAEGETSLQPASERDRLAGTYRLVTSESRDANGVWAPTPDYNSMGYITYSDTGYMGVHVTRENRARFADGQPTPEEAQEALRGYAAYYGPYTVDADGGFLVHHRAGQINPGGEVDAKRFYDFDGDRLILTPAPGSGVKDDAARRIVWERLPDAPLSDEAKRFVGVRQLLYTDSYTERDGELVEHGNRNEGRAGSYIIYTASGHMMVHLMASTGRTPYAGESPTPEEMLAAYRSYGGYFGRFTVHEDDDPPYVVHHIEGRPRPADPSDAVRLYDLSGDVLRLGGRPRTTDGEAAGGHLYWELLPQRPE